MLLIAIIIAGVFIGLSIYLALYNEKNEVDTVTINTPSLLDSSLIDLKNEIMSLKKEDKKTPDVHEIIIRNNEYVPKINDKYLHTDYPSYKFYLDKRFEYCKRYSSEKEAIKAIKQYYEYKDVNCIVHETDLKNCDIVCFPIRSYYYPRVNKQYINSASFSLYKTYKFEDSTTYSISFNTKEEALKFLKTYNNSLGTNDVVIKVDLNLE
jgi:hypothetical protein